MNEHRITVESGSAVRLPTAGKYVDRDIIINATGGTINSYYTDAVLGVAKLGRGILWSNKQIGAVSLGKTSL